MTTAFEIVLPAGHVVSLGEAPLSIGRGPSNDVVLAEASVSWHHSQLWVEGGAAWLRDLGSRNGSWRNGERVVGAARLTPGDRIRLGMEVEVVLQGPLQAAGSWSVRQVEEPASGVRFLVRSDRFTIGGGADCDLRVDGWPDRAATVLLHPNGEIWVGTREGEHQVALGEIFEVRDRRLRVVEQAAAHAPTADWGTKRYPYVLKATANAPSGPQVLVTDPVSGATALVTGNRGVLLFVLARRLSADRAASIAAPQEGWCTTAEAVTGVWGRGRKGGSQLNVLVHRLRSQLESHGFDPWFVEKRRGGIRVRAAEIEVA